MGGALLLEGGIKSVRQVGAIAHWGHRAGRDSCPCNVRSKCLLQAPWGGGRRASVKSEREKRGDTVGTKN